MIKVEVEQITLEAILTVTARNASNDFDKVKNLIWFVCNDSMIGRITYRTVKDKVKRHLLTIHPELKEVKLREGNDWASFLAEQENRFGKVLPVTRIGVKLPSGDSMKVMAVPYKGPRIISNGEEGPSLCEAAVAVQTLPKGYAKTKKLAR